MIWLLYWQKHSYTNAKSRKIYHSSICLKRYFKTAFEAEKTYRNSKYDIQEMCDWLAFLQRFNRNLNYMLVMFDNANCTYTHTRTLTLTHTHTRTHGLTYMHMKKCTYHIHYHGWLSICGLSVLLICRFVWVVYLFVSFSVYVLSVNTCIIIIVTIIVLFTLELAMLWKKWE